MYSWRYFSISDEQIQKYLFFFFLCKSFLLKHFKLCDTIFYGWLFAAVPFVPSNWPSILHVHIPHIPTGNLSFMQFCYFSKNIKNIFILKYLKYFNFFFPFFSFTIYLICLFFFCFSYLFNGIACNLISPCPHCDFLSAPSPCGTVLYWQCKHLYFFYQQFYTYSFTFLLPPIFQFQLTSVVSQINLLIQLEM